MDDLHFSFEATPKTEGWFQTYSRQDAGEDIVYYPESRGFPFALPYEMPLSLFMPYKVEAGKEKLLTKNKHGPKKPAGTIDHLSKFKKRKCKFIYQKFSVPVSKLEPPLKKMQLRLKLVLLWYRYSYTGTGIVLFF